MIEQITQIIIDFNKELTPNRKMSVEAIQLVSKRLFNQLGVTPSELTEVLNNALNGLEEIPRSPDSNMITGWLRKFRTQQPKNTTSEHWDREVNNTPEEEKEIAKILKGMHDAFENRQKKSL